jgi:flagellar basal-body rod protein FlgB
MIEALFNQPNYVGAKKLMEATMLRHEAIASNIANLEQPKYKRVDLAPVLSAGAEAGAGKPGCGADRRSRAQADGGCRSGGGNKDGNSVRLEHESWPLEPELRRTRGREVSSSPATFSNFAWPSPAAPPERHDQPLPGIQSTTAALNAERTRLDIIAQNIANANTTRGLGWQALPAPAGGVRVHAERSPAAGGAGPTWAARA